MSAACTGFATSTSRQTALESDTRDLHHLAGFLHAELGVRQRLSSRFELEGGAAYLDKGALLQSPLLNNAQSNALYYYVQTTLQFQSLPVSIGKV